MEADRWINSASCGYQFWYRTGSTTAEKQDFIPTTAGQQGFHKFRQIDDKMQVQKPFSKGGPQPTTTDSKLTMENSLQDKLNQCSGGE